MCPAVVERITPKRFQLEFQVWTEEEKEALTREFKSYQVLNKDLIFENKSITLRKIIRLCVVQKACDSKIYL